MSALRQKHLVRVIFSEMYFLLKSVMHNTIREGALTSRGRRSPGYEIVSSRGLCVRYQSNLTRYSTCAS